MCWSSFLNSFVWILTSNGEINLAHEWAIQRWINDMNITHASTKKYRQTVIILKQSTVKFRIFVRHGTQIKYTKAESQPKTTQEKYDSFSYVPM